MQEPQTIRRDSPESLSQDFQFLRRQGLTFAQELSGATWTDYNEHDPGVTILEYLTYALTDLGYRTHFDIADLLYAREAGPAARRSDSLFPPSRILPCAPLVSTDYRRLLIDRFPQIDNAWVEPVTGRLPDYRGLYRVRIKLAQDRQDSADTQNQAKTHTIREVADFLNGFRNLGEDFEEIQVLEPLWIHLAAAVTLAPGAVGEYVLAAILFNLQHHFTPKIRSHTLDDLHRRGLALDDILDGPPPQRILTRAEDLPPDNPSIQLSDLRETISRVEGVAALDKFVVRNNGERVLANEIPVGPDHCPALDRRMFNTRPLTHPIRLFRDGIEIAVDLQQVEQILDRMTAREREMSNRPLRFDESRPVSAMALADIAAYHSFQHYFPAVYGIGAFGVADQPTRSRKGLAFQLKAYLLFFEQIMANHLAQLAGFRRLFAVRDASVPGTGAAGAPSYYTQLPGDIPDLDRLFAPDADPGEGSWQDRRNAMEQELNRIVHQNDPGFKRINRLLDHLLARFGESVPREYLQWATTFDPGDRQLEVEWSKVKRNILDRYEDLSRNRGQGFHYGRPAWDSDNVSGVKKRICSFLNWDCRDRSLVKAIDDARLTLGARSDSPEESAQMLSLRVMLRYGTHPGRYAILPWSPPGDEASTPDEAASGEAPSYQLRFRQSADDEQGTRLAVGTYDHCLKLRDTLIDTLGRINEQSRGFFVLEHLLLRPKQPLGIGVELKLTLRLASGQEEQIVFASQNPRFGERAAMEELVENLLLLGAAPEHYRAGPGNEIQLTRPLLRTTLPAADFADAGAVLTELAPAVIRTLEAAAGNVPSSWLAPDAQQPATSINLPVEWGGALRIIPFRQASVGADLRDLATAFLSFGLDPENYRAAAYGTDLIELEVWGPVLVQQGTRPGRQEEVVKALVSTFREMQALEAGELNKYLEYKEQETAGRRIPDSFYAHQVSFILPAWPDRFQETGFRAFFRQMAATHLPTHLAARFHWLNVKQMRTFEEALRAWLEEKRRLNPSPGEDPSGDAANLDAYAFRLVELLGGKPET